MITFEIHSCIGSCITAWAMVEGVLFEICAKALGTADLQAAIVYYRTPTLDARLTLVDELVYAALPKPARRDGGHPHPNLKIWIKLRKRIKDELETRNRIAHHPLGLAVPVSADPDFKNLSGATIFMSSSEKLRGRKVPAKPLEAGDLIDHQKKVQKFYRELRSFLNDVLPKHV